jgi:hypothetical protein
MKRFQTRFFILMAGIIIFGCGKPNDPESFYTSGGYTIITKFQTPANAQDVIVRDTICYIAQGEGGLLAVSIKDPLNPKILSMITKDVRGYSRRIDRKDDHVYLAAGTFGVNVVNISDPHVPFVSASNVQMKPAKDVVVVDNYLFCAVSEQGINIAELSTPGYPDIRGVTVTNGYANGIAVNAQKTLMFVACGELGLSIYDISNFDEGWNVYPLAGWTDTPGYAEAVALYEEKSIALVASGSAGLYMIDYSDLNNLKTIAIYNSGGSAYDMICRGNLVFLTAQRGGIHVLDISDVRNPQVKARLFMKQAMGLDADNKYIYVADNNDGLIIISMPD